MLKNVASQKIGCQMITASDGSAFTGSVTVAVTGDAGTQATGSVGSGACTHEGNGYHTYAPAQAETNYDLAAFTFTGTGAIPATVQVYTLPTTGILSPATLGRTLTVDASGNGNANLVNIAGSAVSTSTAQLGVNVVNAAGTAWNSGAIGASTLATDTITAAKIAADAIGASELAADAATEIGTAVWATGTRVLTANTNLNDPTAAAIADAVWDEDATGHQTGGTFGQAIGDPGANTETLYKAIVTDPAGTNIAADIIAIKAETASILTDTAEIGAAGAGLTVLATAAELAKVPKSDGTATWNATALASIQSEANDALVAYDPPTKAELDAAVANVSVDEIQATALADLFNTDSGTTYASAVAGSVVKEIADNAGGSSLTAADIADAVWEEAIADHSGTTGSTAEALGAAGAAGDPWTTLLPGAYGAGSAGKIIGDNINATISSRASQTSLDTVDGIVDSILVDTAEIGTAGAGLTNINLPNQTMDIVGNITGNLSGSVGSVTGAINTAAGTITTLDALDTAQDTQHSTTQAAIDAVQATVDNIGVGSGGISTTSSSFVKSGAEPETNSYTSTVELDGIYHIVEAAAGATSAYYEFNIGRDGVPIEIEWTGYAQSQGDSYAVSLYNWGDAVFEQVGTIDGSNGTSANTRTFSATVAHVGTGADAGLVRFQFVSADGTAFVTDRLLCTYTVLPAGIANGSTITLAAATNNQNLRGNGWVLSLNGQDIGGTYFYGSKGVVGTATNANGSQPIFDRCAFGTTSLSADCVIGYSIFGGTTTFTSTAGGSTDTLGVYNCDSAVPGGGTPHFDLSGVTKATAVNIRKWSGGLELTLTANCTASLDVISGGTIIVNGAGTLKIRGTVEGVVNNGTTVVTQNAAINNDTFEDAAGAALVTYDPPTKAELDSGFAALNDFDPATDTVAHVTLVDTTTTNTDMRGTNSAALASSLATTDGKIDAIKTVTDNLSDTLEDDGGTYRFTTNALEQAPSGTGGDATEAKQDAIIALIGTPADTDIATDIADNKTAIINAQAIILSR